MAELELTSGMMAAPNIRLVRKLREGGMGSVWVAEHLTLKTHVAVKFILLTLGKSIDANKRFSREASAAAQIKSPHVVQVFDHGVNEQGAAFIVMELLDGEDLGTRLERNKTMPLEDVATIVSQAAKALSKAHANNIVHRDIKPDNIFLMDVEGEVFVKVLDFGIAKQSSETAMNMTSTGVMLGTPFYMAPEQMSNAKDAIPASDLWSLGVVAYHALTGKLPFDGETVAGLAVAVERGKFAKASELVPGISPRIDSWFERIFVKDPEGRFSGAREMGDELMAIVHPNSRRPMISDLTRSYPDAPMAPAAAASAGIRHSTQMGATLDGIRVQKRNRGLAVVGIGLCAAVALAAILFFVFRGKDEAVARPLEPSAAANTSGPGPTVAPATETAAGSVAAPSTTSSPDLSSVPAASSSGPSAPLSASAAPSATAPKGPGRVPGWPGNQTKKPKDRGF